MAIDKKRAEKFNKDIANIMSQLEFDEGYEVFKARLLDLVSRRQIEGESLASYIRQVRRVFDKEFQGFVDRSYQAYNDTLDIVNTAYGDLGVDINRDMQKIQAIEKVNLTRLGQYKDAAVRDISKQVRENIASGKSHTALAVALAKTTDDRVKTYANTIAQTQVKGYGQEAKNEKARLAQIFFFQYVGIRRSTSRVFCIELLTQGNVVFHVNDIAKMINGHNLNVRTYRGGFNCHHDWEPDPFAKKEGYSVSFYSRKDGKRTLKLARSNKAKKTTHFKEAETVREAQRFLRDTYGVNSRFTNVELGIVNQVVGQFDKLSRKFPEVANRLEFMGTKPPGIKGAIASATVDGKEIRLSPALFSNEKRLSNTLRESKNAGWTAKGSGSVEYVISHEFGHHVDTWLGSLPRELRDIKDAWKMKKYSTLSKSDVSGYALFNRNEMFAETFAELQHNKKPRANARSLRYLLGRLLKKVGG